MPPRLGFAPKCVGDPNELVCRHFGKVVVVDYRARPCRLAADYVAGHRLAMVFPVQAMAQVDGGFRAKRLADRPYRQGRRARQARYEVECHIVSCLLGEELLEHLERVRAVASTADMETRGPELGVLLGVLREPGSEWPGLSRAKRPRVGIMTWLAGSSGLT